MWGLGIFIESNRINEKLKVEKNTLLIFIIVFVGLAFIFSYGMDNVAAANVKYVNGSHGNDAWSGTSWATAKHSIRNAVGTVSNNGAIYIASGTYNKEGDIDVKKNISIIGLNPSKTILNETNLHIESGCKVLIKSLTMKGGFNPYYAGAIRNYGSLTLTNSIFKYNGAYAVDSNWGYEYGYGGAICNYGPLLKVISCTFTGNRAISGGGSALGGGIYNSGTCTVTSSIFNNNWADGGGGAIWNAGTLIVSDSSFNNNTAQIGGAIHNENGILTVTQCYFTKNTATDKNYGGGAISNWGTLTAHFNQFIGDTAIHGKEIYNGEGTAIATSNWWGSNSNPTSKVYGGVSVTPWELYVTPKITSTYPKNGATKVSRTLPIYFKFNELIKTSTNWSKIYLKDKYGHALSISKSISGNTLYIQTSKRLSNSYYTVYIPSAAITNYAGNNLIATYTFKFKTGS